MAKRKQDVAETEADVQDEQVRKKLAGQQVASDGPNADETSTADISGLADIAKKILRPSGKISQEAPILARDKTTERKLEAAKQEHREKKHAADEKRKRLEKGHVIPDHSTRNYERGLAKIGTRGVVKLFNSVRKQQRELEEKLESVSEGKKAKVTASVLSKGKFLDMLKEGGQSAGGSKGARETDENAKETRSTWLSESFMMGAKLKDWDRDGPADGEDEEDEEEGEMDESGSDSDE